MSDRMLLIGADDVVRGGHITQAAANDMNRAADTMLEAVRQYKQANEDYLYRLEALLTHDRMERRNQNEDSIQTHNGNR